MTNKKEMTAPCVSVGEDTEQSFQKCSNNIIPQNDENINSLEKMQRELRKMLDPSYLKTMSMTELYDTVFQSRPPAHTFLSAHRSSARVSLWHNSLIISAQAHRCGIIPSEKERFCTLLLKMITADYKKDCIECSERTERKTYSFLFRQVS